MALHAYLLVFLVAQGSDIRGSSKAFHLFPIGLASYAPWSRSTRSPRNSHFQDQCGLCRFSRLCAIPRRKILVGTMSFGPSLRRATFKASAPISMVQSTGQAARALQLATDDELLGVAYRFLDILRPGHLSQALSRIAKVNMRSGKPQGPFSRAKTRAEVTVVRCRRCVVRNMHDRGVSTIVRHTPYEQTFTAGLCNSLFFQPLERNTRPWQHGFC